MSENRDLGNELVNAIHEGADSLRNSFHNMQMGANNEVWIVEEIEKIETWSVMLKRVIKATDGYKKSAR